MDVLQAWNMSKESGESKEGDSGKSLPGLKQFVLCSWFTDTKQSFIE